MTRALSHRSPPAAAPLFMPVLKAVLLLALVARSLIPLGFMPGQAVKDGLFPLVICSGASVQTVYLPASKIPGTPAGDHHQADSHAACIFALNALFHGAAPAPTLPLLALAAAALPAFGQDAARYGDAPAPYDSQGPPVSLLHD